MNEHETQDAQKILGVILWASYARRRTAQPGATRNNKRGMAAAVPKAGCFFILRVWRVLRALFEIDLAAICILIKSAFSLLLQYWLVAAVRGVR
jgi:hypothetical protein